MLAFSVQSSSRYSAFLFSSGKTTRTEDIVFVMIPGVTASSVDKDLCVYGIRVSGGGEYRRSPSRTHFCQCYLSDSEEMNYNYACQFNALN